MGLAHSLELRALFGVGLPFAQRPDMRQLLAFVAAVGVSACAEKSGDFANPPGAGGSIMPSAGASGSTMQAAGAGGTGTQAAGSSGTAMQTAGAAGAVVAPACTQSTPPADATNLYVEFPGDIHTYNEPSGASSIDGYVFVERVQPDRIDLVDASGQRVSVGAAKPAFGGLAVGSRLWLTSYLHATRDNPYAYRRRAVRFTLRTDRDGPILAAAMEQMHEQGSALLGVPMAIRPHCSVSLPSFGVSQVTKADCSVVEQRFDVLVSTEPPVQILPGARVEASLGASVYELTLWGATNVSYPDSSCAPADWSPSVGFALDVVARGFAALAATAPVVAEQLPLCRLGTDPAVFSMDLEGLDWSGIVNGTLESSMVPASTQGNEVVFALPSLGRISVNASSPGDRAILERGRWFTMASSRNYLIREAEGGRVIAAQLAGAPSSALTGVARYDLLGVSAAVEAKCEWMSAACRDNGAVEARLLYDVILGGATNQRLTSHTRGTVTLDAQAYAAWIAVTPDCTETPMMNSTFLVQD